MGWTISKIPKDKQKQIVNCHTIGDYASILSIVVDSEACTYDYCCPTDPSFRSYIDGLIEGGHLENN